MSATAHTQQAVEQILDRGADADDVLRQVAELIHDRCEHYSWVGIYLVEGDELVLGPWKGPEATEHVRIPIGQGICGAAAASGQTEIVDDVNADPRYLACFPSTRSEIVVPIAYQGRVVGEIDIDSDEPAAFTDADRVFLERVAALISPLCLVAWDTGGVPWGDSPARERH
jgi:L-methionine (R)-S-oxide reductase